MSVYLISCFASMLLIKQMTIETGRKLPEGIITVFSAMPFIFISALRYNVGQDYSGFSGVFDMLRLGISFSNLKLEPLYHFLNTFVIWLGGSYQIIIAICAVLFFIPFYSQIYRDSPDPALSVFLLMGMGYLFVSFNAIRQMVGVAILIYSLRFVQERKLLPFLICVAAATGFHTTNALFIIVYIFPYIRIRPVLVCIMTLLIWVTRGLISSVANQIIRLTQYGVYISSEFDTGETAYVMLAINIVLMLMLSVFYVNDDDVYQLYYNLQIVALCITMFSGKIVLIIRLLWIFGPASVISLPMSLKHIRDARLRHVSTICVYILYLVYSIYTVGIQNSNNVLPYQSILNR